MRIEGVYFDEYKVGDRFQTLGRTITETDIVNFVTLVGMNEPLFLDVEYVARESVFKGRVVPGALTFAYSEGLAIQTGLLHGTGMAYLGSEIKVLAPVLAGDTIRVEIEVVEKKEVSKPDRGVVSYLHRVKNQRGEVVMEVRVQRMIRRRPKG